MTRQAMRRSITAASALVLAGAVAGLSSAASAGERAGVKMPDVIEVGRKQLVLNGLGVREATLFKVDVYVAGLYLERRSKDPAEILDTDDSKVLHLMFVRDVDRSDVVDAFREGFEKNSHGIDALRPRIDTFLALVPAFNEHGTLTLTYIPGRGTFVAVDGTQKGTIKGADFARALFAIWLGPKPPNSGLKRGLLGR
jgi:hypothetical protein